MLIKNFHVDDLAVFIHDTRKCMGEQVAVHFAECVKNMLKEKEVLNIVFAAAPSQNDFLFALMKQKDIDYERINIFHMDEYVGISMDKPQSFARFVKENVADYFLGAKFYALDGKAKDLQAECIRYETLLKEYPPDIVCMGIGENGHIAFNDPWNADFWDEKFVKVVELDEACRVQQVNDGCFAALENVPKYAFTLTIPALLRAKTIFCTVPCIRKAAAVKKTLEGHVSIDCPATALRLHKNAYLYCDEDSASLLTGSN